MGDLFKNKLFWLCIGLFGFNMFFFVAEKVVVDKVADEVIERLESEYSPSPYGPGFDPDVVEPEAIRQQKLSNGLKKNGPITEILEATEWSENWEHDRGFSQSQ